MEDLGGDRLLLMESNYVFQMGQLEPGLCYVDKNREGR